jgi:hypothetical protein
MQEYCEWSLSIILLEEKQKITTYSGGTAVKHSLISDKRHHCCDNLFYTTCKLERKFITITNMSHRERNEIKRQSGCPQ